MLNLVASKNFNLYLTSMLHSDSFLLIVLLAEMENPD